MTPPKEKPNLSTRFAPGHKINVKLPSERRVVINVTLAPDVAAWLRATAKAQGTTVSALLDEIVRKAMAR